MSVFNQTFENLLEDGYVELNRIETVFRYMQELLETETEYTVKYKYNWIDKVDCWLIEIKK